MGELDHRVIASMLLSVLAFVLATGVFLVFLMFRWRQLQRSELAPKSEMTRSQGWLATPDFRHLTRRNPDCWLAIRNSDPHEIQKALTLHDPRPCGWAEGLSRGERKLFVSPPVGGWIFVFGSALPDPGDDVDLCFRFLMELSRKVGRVQYFNANTILDHHAWIQVETGRVLRAYAWAGRTVWNQGRVTQTEMELGMKCREYAESSEPVLFSSRSGRCMNSEKVHALAARWGLDPEEIDENRLEREMGIVGEPERRF